MLRRLAPLFVLAALPLPLSAQQDLDQRRTAMQRLAFLVGEWEGPAWAQTGPGARVAMRQTERVRMALEEMVLVIEGTGRDSSGSVVFNAFAVISWTPEAGYLMRSWTREGRYGEFPVDVRDGGFTWSMSGVGGGAGEVRYTMQLTPEGQWLETGEYSPNGERWFPTFEMRLERAGPSDR